MGDFWQKTIFLVSIFVLTIFTAAAEPEIKSMGGDTEIWSNDNVRSTDSTSNVEEFKLICGNGQDISNVNMPDGGEIPDNVNDEISGGQAIINNSDIEEKSEAGSVSVELVCDAGGETDRTRNDSFDFRKLEAEIHDRVMRYRDRAHGQGQNISGTGDPPMGPPRISAGISERSTRPDGRLNLIDAESNNVDRIGSETEGAEDGDSRLILPIYPFEEGHTPSGDGSVEQGRYDFRLEFTPKESDMKVLLDAEDLTDDNELPMVEIYPQYRITGVTKEAEASRDSLMSYEDLQGFTYRFDLSYLGEPVKLGSDEGVPRGSGYIDTAVYTYSTDDRDGEIYNGYEQENWFNGTRHTGGGRWATSLGTSPVLESGKYRLVNKINLPDDGRGPIKLGEIFVERNMDFNGKVVDSSSSRNPIDATFRFFDGGTKENDFSTSPDGTYTSRVDRKTYDSVEMDFYDERSRSSATESFDARVTASDVEIGDSQGSVRFDYFRNPSVSIPGISPVNMMATQFGYDVGDVTEIEMAYNSGRVSVERAQVFECRNWNYFARSCQTDWERLDEDDYDVNPVSEQVSIAGAEPYVLPEDLSGSRNSQRILKNAYVVGTAADLGLQGDIEVGAEGGRAPVGSDISVSGNVVAGGGTPVANADVTANLSIGGEEYGSQTTQTDAEGRFSASLEAPESPGNYTVSVASEKQPYSSFSESFDKSLTAYVEKGVQVSLKGVTGGQLSLVKGREIEKEIEVLNTGQRPVKDVEVSVSNLDEDFYNLSSARINEIAEGDTESVGLDILIPETLALNQFPSFTVSAQGSSGNKQVSSEAQIFTVVNQVSDVEDRNDSSQTETGENSSSMSATQGSSNLLGSFPSAPSLSLELPSTGDFAGQTSDVNLILGLVFVFLLVVAAAVKKRDSGSGEERGRISHDRPAVTSVSGGATNLAGGTGARGSMTMEQDGASSDGAVSQPSEDENVCGECGEEFDTDAALEMHREAAH